MLMKYFNFSHSHGSYRYDNPTDSLLAGDARTQDGNPDRASVALSRVISESYEAVDREAPVFRYVCRLMWALLPLKKFKSERLRLFEGISASISHLKCFFTISSRQRF